MAFVRSFEDFSPPQRYDSIPFVSVGISEAETLDGPFADIDTQFLSPVDSDPSEPVSRDFTTALAQFDPGWYKLAWTDGAGAIFESDPIFSGEVTLDLGRVRLAIGDTDEEDRLFTDEEIEVYIGNNTVGTVVDIHGAAADLCEVLANRFARQFDFAEDGQSFSLSQRSSQYAVRAKELRYRSSSGNSSVPLVSSVNAAIGDNLPAYGATDA